MRALLLALILASGYQSVPAAVAARAPNAAQRPDAIFADGFDGPNACLLTPGLTRQLSGTVSYPDAGGQRVRSYSSFAQIWGHATANDVEVPWPGTHGASPIPSVGRHTYFAAQFTVPANVSATAGGFIQRTTYSYGISMTAAYSRSCGDFHPSNPGCLSVTTGVPLPFPKWNTTSLLPLCHLTAGNTYYLNVKATNPAEVTPTCAASSANCPMATTNYVNN